MPVGGAFIGSFITVNGAPLSHHMAMAQQMAIVFERAPDSIDGIMNEAKANSQKIVPVKTGFLRASINWERLSRYMFRFFASAKYARYVEEGTHRMRARPYMFPSVAIIKQKVPQVIISQILSFVR
jgi:HK97 gp10 family phage protein